jgi:hypothetical protein
MKNKLKKISIVFSTIFIMLLSCVPLSAFAASVSQVGDKYTITLAEMQKENVGQYYLYYNYWIPWNGGYHSQVYYFYTDVEPTYEKSGNIYTISFTTSLKYSYYLLRDTGSSYDSKKGQSSFIETITYNADTQVVTTSGGGFGGFEQFNLGATIIDFQSNMFSTEAVLDVDVSFRPPLSGVVNRTVHDQDGNEGLSQIFSMHVQNNSDKAIQYIMEIKEKDTNQLIYDYLTNEWVYSYDVKDSASYCKSMDFKGEHVVLQYKPAREHHVAAGAGDTQIFKFCQIPFEKDKEYIVTVRASLTNLDNASSIIFGAFDYQFTGEDYTEVYSSTFSISDMSGIAFDSSDTSNGVLPYGDDSARSSLLNSRDAIKNKDGSIDYKSYNAYTDPDSPHNKFGEGIGNNVIGGSKNSYNYSGSSSFTGMYGSAVSFVLSFFSFLPDGFLQMFLIGFSVLIVVAIVKAVK